MLDKKLDDRKDFIVSEDEFHRTQTLARFELCEILLGIRSYPAAIYHAQLLLKKYPENKFLQTTIGYSLYGLSQYKNVERYDEVYTDYKEVEGEMQQVFHLFHRIKPQNLALITSRHLWNLHKKYPNDKQLELMLRDQIEDMVIYQIEDPLDFFSPNEMRVDTSLHKYARIAFREINEDPVFLKMLKDGKKYRTKFEKDKKLSKRQKKKKKKTKEKQGLGLNKVVYLSPKFYRVNGRNFSLNYLYSEKRQAQYHKLISKTAKKAKLKAKIIDTRNSQSTKAKDFNNATLLKSWSSEMLDHDMYMITHNYNQVQPLAKLYNTPNIVLMSSLTVKTPKSLGNVLLLFTDGSAYLLIGTVFYPYLLPYTYSIAFKPQFENWTVSTVLDIENNQILRRTKNIFKQKANKHIIQMSLYESMQKIKKPK